MTSLRGPDPYAAVEERLARLFVGPNVDLVEVCRALHETVPTYNFVGVASRDPDKAAVIARSGAPMLTDPLATACLPGADDPPLVLHDVIAAPIWRRCYPGARAVIAVPSGRERALVVVSEHQGAFGLADRALLERVAQRLAAEPDATGEC